MQEDDVTTVASRIVSEVLSMVESLGTEDGDEDQVAKDLADSMTYSLHAALRREVYSLLGLDPSWVDVTVRLRVTDDPGFFGATDEPRILVADNLRAGPWKSGYGEYPFADEVYDLTHASEPMDPYDDDRAAYEYEPDDYVDDDPGAQPHRFSPDPEDTSLCEWCGRNRSVAVHETDD